MGFGLVSFTDFCFGGSTRSIEVTRRGRTKAVGRIGIGDEMYQR